MILIKHPKYLTQLIIILSNAKYKHTKVVPVVSIDVNNLYLPLSYLMNPLILYFMI